MYDDHSVIGRILGHYKIVQMLGQGGMGIVYKAHDTHLDRFVAIKVLPADKVGDSERKLRFVQEAKAASALNHPNIVVVHDVAAADGIDYIAMEYVSGRTLNQIVNGRPMPLRETLSIAIQVADALARAHQAGILHRDLKPANIMIDERGQVKLLDFGLAKLTDGASEGSSTKTVADPLTGEGAVMGTAAYMSPEQAEGRRLDARSDIFSFGLVLYEMITGQPAFRSASTASTLAAILRDEPRPIREIAPGTPGEMERVVARCMKKDPARRFQHADDLKVQLHEIKEDHESGKLAPAPSAQAVRWSWTQIGALCAVLAGVVAALWFMYRGPQPAGLSSPVLTRLTSDAGLTFQPSLSPDGKLIAYSSDRAGDGGLDVWVQQVAGGEPIRRTRDPADEQEPSFSPDSSRIVFSSGRDGGGIYVMSALGGAHQKIAEFGVGPRFSPDGKWIAYRTGNRLTGVFDAGALYVVPAGGGVPRRLAPTLANVIAPVWSPDGKSILIFGVHGGATSNRTFDWWIVDLESGEMRRPGILAELQTRKLAPTNIGLASQHLLPFANQWTNNHIIFTAFSGQVSNVWRLPFSALGHRVSGPPERLTAGTGLESNASVPNQSDERVLAFSSALENIDLWSLPLLPDEAKLTGDLQRLTRGLGADVRPSISQDGTRLVYNSNPAGNWDVWLKDLRTGEERALVSSEIDEENPRIDRDGHEVLYRVAREVYSIPAAGGLKRKVVGDCELFSWMPLARSFLCTESRGLFLADVESGSKMHLVAGTAVAPRLSWDGRWATFYRNVPGGSAQIFVSPVMQDRPAVDADLIQITDGKTWDALSEFSPDGNILYFQSERDGARCLWGQRLDAKTKKPLGVPFPVLHFHKPGLSLAHVMPGHRALTVARNKIILVAAERTGNVWLSRFERW